MLDLIVIEILKSDQNFIDSYKSKIETKYTIIETDSIVGIGYKYDTQNKIFIPPLPDGFTYDKTGLKVVLPLYILTCEVYLENEKNIKKQV